MIKITPPNDNHTYSWQFWNENLFSKAFANETAPKNVPVLMAQKFDAKCACRDCEEYTAEEARNQAYQDEALETIKLNETIDEEQNAALAIINDDVSSSSSSNLSPNQSSNLMKNMYQMSLFSHHLSRLMKNIHQMSLLPQMSPFKDERKAICLKLLSNQ